MMNFGYGPVIRLGVPMVPRTQNSFLQRIHQLEDRKMEMIVKDDIFDPSLFDKFEEIDRKLAKYYRWYASAYVAGKI
jgi:hypothetical protein